MTYRYKLETTQESQNFQENTKVWRFDWFWECMSIDYL
jgi:hypothetical protein